MMFTLGLIVGALLTIVVVRLVEDLFNGLG